MKAHNHTKGPWTVTNSGLLNSGLLRASHQHQIGTPALTIAYTWCPVDESGQACGPLSLAEHEANARLICRAPELLQAATMVRKAFNAKKRGLSAEQHRSLSVLALVIDKTGGAA